MNYKSYVASLAAAGLLGGCTTAKITEHNLRQLSDKQSQQVSDLLERIPQQSEEIGILVDKMGKRTDVYISPANRTSLGFEESRKIAADYEGLLNRQRLNVYWPDENGKFSPHMIDTALLNNHTDELKTLEGLIVGDNTLELTLAPASKDVVAPYTQRNQLNNNKADRITSRSEGDPNFALGIYVDSSPGKSKGTIKVEFGKPEQKTKLYAEKVRNDIKADALSVGLNMGVGYIIAREAGLIFPAAIYGLDATTSYIGSQIRPVPEGTTFTEDTSFMAVEGTDPAKLRVASALNGARKNLVIFPHNNTGFRGTGMVSLEEVVAIKSWGNTMEIITSDVDPVYWQKVLYGLGKNAIIAGTVEAFCDHDGGSTRPQEGQNNSGPGQNLQFPQTGGGITGSPGSIPAVPQGGGSIGGSPAAGGSIGGSPGTSP